MAKFPDLNKDGEVTKADVLKGRGVGDYKMKRIPKDYGEEKPVPQMKRTPKDFDNEEAPKMQKLKSGGSTSKWIQEAVKKPGALRKALGAKKGEPIPAKKLAAAAKKPGKMNQRARLAQTLKGLKK